MGQNYVFETEHAREHLLEAARTREPVTITYHAKTGWIVIKGRFAGEQDGSGALVLEQSNPLRDSEPAPEFGQELGVSYRRGSRKCVFTAAFVDSQPSPKNGRPLLRLTWPEQIEELQRRMYHRTPVPQGRLIPVDLWLAQAQAADSANSAHRGTMVDLSAGGLSVELPRESRPRWREDEQLACRFSTGPDRPPIEVTARLTNYTRMSDGHVRVGLQFLGLDTNDRGRNTLHRISRMASWLRD